MGSRDVFDEARDRNWNLLTEVFQHFGAPKSDRYAGEFFVNKENDEFSGDVTGVSYSFSYGYPEIRDALAEAFSSVADEKGQEKASVTVENDGYHWPYGLTIKVAGKESISCLEALNGMTPFLAAVASKYPAPDKGISWKSYIDQTESEEARLRPAWDYHMERFGWLNEMGNGAAMRLVGEHTSKRHKLPVVQLELPNKTMITIRDNYHDYCVSVAAPFPVKNTRDFKSLFKTTGRDGYFEGFPGELIHGSYKQNPQKFSFCVGGYPALITVLAEIMRQDSKAKVVSKLKDCADQVVRKGSVLAKASYRQMEMFNMISKLTSGVEMHVVGEHIVQGASFPVVQAEFPQNSTKITIRDNLKDICVSVDSRFPIENTRRFESLFKTTETIGKFEGFPEDLIHGSYKENAQKFSLCVGEYPSLMVLVAEVLHQDLKSKFVPLPIPSRDKTRSVEVKVKNEHGLS